MPKKVIKTETYLTFDSEKQHSVLYKHTDTKGTGVVSTSVYVRKECFAGVGAYPNEIKITLEAVSEGN